MSTIIYAAVLNNEVRYVGITGASLAKRVCNHRYEAYSRNSGLYFHNALRKYKDLITFKVLEVVESREEACFLEKYYIKHYNTYHENRIGYNCTYGGDKTNLGIKFSKEAREKMSRAKLGKKRSGSNFKHSEETKLFLSKFRKENPLPIATRRKVVDEKRIVYSSVTEAALKNNLKRTTVTASIKFNRKNKNGKKFNYYKGDF